VSLEGRGVLVVGGGSPYGGRLAAAAAAAGASVVYTVLPGHGEDGARAPGSLAAVAADPSREDEAERVFAVALGRLPRIDVVVQATAKPQARRLLDASASDWDREVAAPLRAAFFVSRLAVEEFLAHGAGGRLLHVAPLVLPGDPGQAMAAAALEALLSLMRSTAKEYGPRQIACNAVVPVPAAARAGAPAPTPGDAVAEAVLFLASDEASYLNGDALRVADAVP
jgi:NAD(P)-dependent dehydrogenase (short-subunit alcohol dehydrogenase family)